MARTRLRQHPAISKMQVRLGAIRDNGNGPLLEAGHARESGSLEREGPLSNAKRPPFLEGCID